MIYKIVLCKDLFFSDSMNVILEIMEIKMMVGNTPLSEEANSNTQWSIFNVLVL